MTLDVELQELAQAATESGPCRFEISSANLQYLLSHAATLVGELMVHVKGGQLSYRAVDAAHVAMCQGSAPINHQETDKVFGLNVDLIRGLLKPVPIANPEPFTITVDDRWVTLTAGRYTYEVRTVDTSGMHEPKIPNITTPAEFEIAAKDWSNWLKRAACVSDHIRIGAAKDHGNQVHVHAEGAGARLKAHLDAENMTVGQGVSSLYSLDYLDSMRKAYAFQGTARFHLGTDYPIRIETQPGECVCRTWLAPWITAR